MRATCIVVDGPFPAWDDTGEEIANYIVCLTDDYGDDVGTVEHYYSYKEAIARGQELSRQFPDLELVIEAS